MSTKDVLNRNLLMLHAQFPRIGKAIELFWGHKDFTPYVSKLLASDRHDRQGFPADVLFAIMELQALHDSLFPQFAQDDPDIWINSQFGIR